MGRMTYTLFAAAAGAAVGMSVAGCSSGGTVEVGQRYALATWATPPAASSSGTVIDGRHGAYRIDTKTGEVWSVDDQNHVGHLPPP